MAATPHNASENLTSTLRETRLFAPPAEFAAHAHVQSVAQYQATYRRSIESPEEFWMEQAKALRWFREPSEVVDWNALKPETAARWFADGTLNMSDNCVDRHVAAGRGDRTALIWEGELGETRTLTFSALLAEVERCASMLRMLGVGKGDRVAIYMGMSLEVAIAMLACTRIGAVHSVIFGGFAPQAIADRILDADCRVVLTQDGTYRRGGEIKLKQSVDEALKQCPDVQHVVVYARTGSPLAMHPDRDLWWHDAMAAAEPHCAPEQLAAEDPLFILYTSGTTGKPKGLVHTNGGYAVGSYLTTKLVFDLHPETRDDDVFWCTADVGWITGHSYVLYGALLNGVTTLLYEGAPNFPDPGRFWQVIDRHRVTAFYTAPTAIRAFMKWGDSFPRAAKLDSLRVLGTVGEPINPEAWMWYHTEIGRGRCPIADTWWQTETGAHMLTPLPGAIATKPGSATVPFFGVLPEIVTKQGEPVPDGQGGLLVIRKPWPSMARTIWGDHDRYVKTYWSEIPGCYFSGDGARRDEDGYYWLMGRVDDVINVSGHRLGTMEIESALIAHRKVSEAAAVGKPHELKGQAIAVFVTLESGHAPSAELMEELRTWVAKEIGSLARPDEVRFLEQLPKTRSGKIMRRLLRELAEHGEIRGDITTLEDFGGLAKAHEEDD
ncbi:acetate--CoA ligase [Acidipila sp. EB88]|uniref:acetate--CoA ligase n=1 Tax=Acidipila sp. EB88 TaxID=2305226 RepID=UPI000F5D6162|nr:acetate--CoA ligase [Acidipila sp. EB88]RRA48861.1 acetate--CoA ligase [Acidipila sp. EB88]